MFCIPARFLYWGLVFFIQAWEFKDEKRRKYLFALVETITGENESHMNVVSIQQVSNECSLKWTWSQTNESQTNKSQLNVVSNERISHECGLKWTGHNSTSLKWIRSQMNVVSKERVANQQISNERGFPWSILKWTWPQMCGLKWSSLKFSYLFIIFIYLLPHSQWWQAKVWRGHWQRKG